MGLTTIFFKANNDFGYVKAIIRKEDKEFFNRLGTVYDSPDDIPSGDNFDFKLNQESETVDLNGLKIDPTPTLGIGLNEIDQLSSNPDKGFGKIGSYEWHQTQIKAMDDKPSILNYVKSVTGKTISNRGALLTVKLRGLETVKEFMSHDDKSK